jgi:hypothetical protein
VLGIRREEVQKYCKITVYKGIINTTYTNAIKEVSDKLNSELISKEILHVMFIYGLENSVFFCLCLEKYV